jgi:hypothetical protein
MGKVEWQPVYMLMIRVMHHIKHDKGKCVLVQ